MLGQLVDDDDRADRERSGRRPALRLRTDGERLGVERGFSIFDTDDSKRLLKQVMGDLNIDPKQFTPNATRAVISKWKNDDLDPAKAEDEFIFQNSIRINQRFYAALGDKQAFVLFVRDVCRKYIYPHIHLDEDSEHHTDKRLYMLHSLYTYLRLQEQFLHQHSGWHQ